MPDYRPHRSAVPSGTGDHVARRVLTLERLAGQLQKLERTSHPVRDSNGTVSSGLEILDRLLPDAGFHSGTLIEWIAEKGSADQLALLAARSALGEDRVLIVIDDEESLYPPAAAALGIDLRQLILVRPGKVARRGVQAKTEKRPAAASVETLWALEQAPASRGVAVTFCRLENFCASLPAFAIVGGTRRRSRVFDSAAHCAGRAVLERRAIRGRDDGRGRLIVRTALASRSPSLPTRSSRRKVCPLGIRRCDEYCASDCSNRSSRLCPASTRLVVPWLIAAVAIARSSVSKSRRLPILSS